MNDKNLMKAGLTGSVVALLCCVTPLLVFVVTAVGLSAIVGWLDYALFPLFFASLGVVAYAIWLQAGQPGRNPRLLIIAVVVITSALLLGLQFRFALRITGGAVLAVVLYWYWLRRLGGDRSSGEPGSL